MEDLCSTFFALNRGKGALYDGTTRLARQDHSPIAMYSMAGLAEYVVIPATAVYPLPESVDVVDAAIVGCAIFTAYGAVRNAARMQPGESCAVIGTGGVGANIIQIASKAWSARQVIAIDVSDEKLALMRELGATHTINARTEDVQARILALSGGRGVDLCFEALGKAETFSAAVAAVRDGGRAVMVGIAPQGVTAPVDITRLVRRQVKILGSYGAKARVDLPHIVQLIDSKTIDVSKAVTKRFPLQQADQAYKLLDQGKIVGRAVIDMEMK